LSLKGSSIAFFRGENFVFEPAVILDGEGLARELVLYIVTLLVSVREGENDGIGDDETTHGEAEGEVQPLLPSRHLLLFLLLLALLLLLLLLNYFISHDLVCQSKWLFGKLQLGGGQLLPGEGSPGIAGAPKPWAVGGKEVEHAR